MWNKLDRTATPTADDFAEYIHNPLFERFCLYLDEEYHTAPQFEYSGCSLPGWNAKFRKSGKSLCTVYPYENYFTVLIVVGKKEKEQVKDQLPLFTPYIQELYHNTKEGMGQRWLLIDFEDEYLFEDIKKLIAIRCGK